MRRLTLIATIAALALAGCGGDDEKAPSGGGSSSSSRLVGGESLTIAADPGGALKFDKNTLTAKAGKVTITMDNPSDTPHNVAIDVEGAKGGPDRRQGREIGGQRRPQGRRVQVLLRRRQPPRRGHGGQPHRPVTSAGTARAR